ncbi:MAG: alpha/beta hydrolase [Proteobacteria bacterium]|nr:alpha/beta hydrolase [Pseudomonadota bacterium]MBU1965758.1 alpha/beta hydrolase [Pseudomonadota bacterium]
MIDLREIGGRKLACWVNDGGFRAGRKTLVFIHGSGGNHTDWIRQFTPLQNKFNIAVMDLPGHGQSDGPGEEDVPAYVAWVKKFLEGFGIEKPVLIGHSLGAAICLVFAIRHGDAASAVVAVGGGSRMPVNPIILEGLKQDPAAIIGLAAKFSIAKENRERLSGFITENLSRANPETIYGDFFACSRLDIAEAVAGIRIPALILCGAEDKMTPPALSEYLRDHIPGAGLALIPGAGHFVMLENPEAFNAALADFVNALPA